MKQISILVLSVYLLFSEYINAQCVSNINSPEGIYPKTLTSGCLGNYYSDTITYRLNKDTIYGGFTVPFDSLKIKNVTNRPAGLNYTCEHFDCTAYASGGQDFYQCFDLSGIPTTATATTTDSIFIEYEAAVTIFGFPVFLTLLDTVFISINNAVDTAVTQSGATLTANNASATYQWVDCNNGNAPIAGAINQSFSPAINGSYAAEITQNGCTSTSSCFTVSNVGINRIPFGNLLIIYPNPVESKLFVELEHEMNDVTIELFNSIGTSVMVKQFTTFQNVGIPVDFPRGIYFIKISADGTNEEVRKLTIL